ncbi:raffinose/stachyose/melibiose transport system substrate-binding protein [Lachnospiraceae bacterium C7]|nr:raffinose/stachyose/melibiose transport system substrate-binding protein [Lachnospiraceae bacterium C7]
MKKRVSIVFLILSLLVTMFFTGCEQNNDVSKASLKSKSKSKTITLLNNKSEVESQLEELAKKYETDTGVKVEIESVPAGVDSQAVLKGYYLSDKMPDIVVCEAAGFENWKGLFVDMSNEKWIQKTESAYIDEKYGTIGFPYATEAVGLTYNADILAKAGIDPSKLTSPEAYQQAFSKIDSMKGQLGLKAVVGYCAEDKEMYWSTGNHIFGNYLDAGLKRDDSTYIDMLQDGGHIDRNRMMKFASFLTLMGNYSDPELLLQGTYDQQVENFASGKYAFVTQGSWIGAILTGAKKEQYASAGNFKVGMAPYAFEDGIDTILTSAPAWWAVLKEGNVDEAQKFLQWCTEDEAQKILVEDAGFVSPFTDCKYEAKDPFASVIKKYLSDKKTSAWHFSEMKENTGRFVVAPEIKKLASKESTEDVFVSELSNSLNAFYSN